MNRKNWIFMMLIFLGHSMIAQDLTSATLSKKWMSLLDADLSQWEVFMGVPHESVVLDGFEKSEDVHVGTPMGLNQDVKHVFKMIDEKGVDVLHVSGEIYGGLTSKSNFGNYHLSLQFKWGDKKWEPRLKDKKDSGLLYHCTGNHGAFWNVWKRCLEFQIQETDVGDFIGLAGANGMVRTCKSEDGRGYRFSKMKGLQGVGEHYGNWECKKASDHENAHGDWNIVELFVIGGTAIHVVNGYVVNLVEDAHTVLNGKKIPLVSGQIQLQSEAAEIFYKDVKIRNLTKFPKKHRKAAGL